MQMGGEVGNRFISGAVASEVLFYFQELSPTENETHRASFSVIRSRSKGGTLRYNSKPIHLRSLLASTSKSVKEKTLPSPEVLVIRNHKQELSGNYILRFCCPCGGGSDENIVRLWLP